MSTIKVNCTDQVLTLENTPTISSGGVKTDQVEFTFCELWTGYVKTAVFWRRKDEPYHVLMGSDNVAEIPKEVLADSGTIKFGAYGVSPTGAVRTTEILSYDITQGIITKDAVPDEPSPDIYLQLLANYAAILATRLAAENISVPADTAGELGLAVTDPTVDDALSEIAMQIKNLQPEEGDGGNVKYDAAQGLTDEQKAQARANIGAAAENASIDGGAVMYDTVQDLADTQKARARSNIGAVSTAEVTEAINTALGDYSAALASMDGVIGGTTA